MILGLLHPAMPQEIIVNASNRDVNLGTTSLHKVIGHDPDHFFVIKFMSNQYYLEILDQDLNPIVEEPLKLFQGIKTYDFEAIVHFHNELYLFFSRARLNDITLYYQKISKSNLQPTTDIIEVTNVRNIKGAWADFHFALSRSETRLMVACITKLAWSGAQFNEFFVFGEGLGLIWRNKDSFEFRGQGPRDNKFIVDEKGNISILSLVKEENIFSLFRKNRNLYTIYRYTQNGETFNQYPITLADKYIRGVRIVAGEQGELICAGLYSEIYKTGVRGTFFFKIDAETGRIYDNSLTGFDDALLAQLANMKEPMLKQEELINYVVTDMVFRGSDKIMIVSEQVFNQTHDTFNNLIITCYDVNGQVYWTRVVEKSQDFHYATAPGKIVELSDYRNLIMETGLLDYSVENYCSYALMAPLDQTWIALFYNDDIRNIDGPAKRKNFKRIKKSYLLGMVIDEFGNVYRKPLMKWEKKALYPEPVRFYDTLRETIVIPAFRYRNYNYYKIKVNYWPGTENIPVF